MPRSIVPVLLTVLILASCDRGEPPREKRGTRAITITTVPLLVKEQASTYPFLDDAFKKGGVLDGKEVYAFSPSTITVYEGDTIAFHFVNPEDDEHSFVLPDFSVALPGGSSIDTSYVAQHAGIYTFICSVPGHMPMMSGQLVVLK
jgi:uncharacterized cupredoxin-like copper-binding protein